MRIICKYDIRSKGVMQFRHKMGCKDIIYEYTINTVFQDNYCI